MKFLKKSALSLSVIVASGLNLSTSALAQYPNQMQIYQTQCQQGDRYSCIQLEQMYRRNDRWANQRNQMRNNIDKDQEYINRMNRQKACRRGSYTLNDSHCNYID